MRKSSSIRNVVPLSFDIVLFLTRSKVNMVTDKLEILAFGIAKEIMGGSIIKFDISLPTTVLDLKQEILLRFPKFEDIRSLGIAVNNEYCSGKESVKSGDEVAVIPPVSGG